VLQFSDGSFALRMLAIQPFDGRLDRRHLGEHLRKQQLGLLRMVQSLWVFVDVVEHRGVRLRLTCPSMRRHIHHLAGH